MRWRTERRSENIEDRRGMRPAGIAIGGAGSLIVLVILLLLGADPRDLFTQHDSAPPMEQTDAVTSPQTEELKDFVSVVLAETEDVWNAQFQQLGYEYREPTLVLFTDVVQSACGFAGAAAGPFYCPGDEKVYIDLGFFELLRNRFGAPGDFAEAYVVAHEVGHHVQKLLGITEQMDRLRGQVSDSEAHELSVRLELQADFLAGVWAHHTEKMKHLLESGDIEEALNAASSIGDDRLQMETRGYVVPESFTHGTSEQRERWFRLGFETGDLSQGDTFKARAL